MMKYKLTNNIEEQITDVFGYLDGFEYWELIEDISYDIERVLKIVTPKLDDDTMRKLAQTTIGAAAIDGLDKQDVEANITCLRYLKDHKITDRNYSIDILERIIEDDGMIEKHYLKKIEDILVKNMTDELVELLAPYEDGREFLIEHKDLNSTITAAVNMYRLQEEV